MVKLGDGVFGPGSKHGSSQLFMLEFTHHILMIALKLKYRIYLINHTECFGIPFYKFGKYLHIIIIVQYN